MISALNSATHFLLHSVPSASLIALRALGTLTSAWLVNGLQCAGGQRVRAATMLP